MLFNELSRSQVLTLAILLGPRTRDKLKIKFTLLLFHNLKLKVDGIIIIIINLEKGC